MLEFIRHNVPDEELLAQIADVLLCLEVMGYDMKELAKYRAVMDAKLERWAGRLSEKGS